MMGTYNKLLSLGDSAYLEIIAIDPDSQRPNRPRWFNLDKLQQGNKPQLITWVVRTNDIKQAVSKSKLQHGMIESLQRGIYDWQITIPSDGEIPMQGIAPTIIQWKDDRHPAQNLSASEISLLNIQAFHQRASTLIDSLASIGFQGNFSAKEIGASDKPMLRVSLKCPKGVITFESQN